MDPTRPARVDPAKIVEAIRDWQVTQTFGSPAVWNRVGRWCQEREVRLPTVRRVLSAGAPVGAEVLRQMTACIHAEGEVHTPYGATEALPVASISSREVLAETAEKTRGGAGVCVGRRFPGIRWKVIPIVPGPIASLDEIEELPPGEIGELIVSGPVVTRQYVTRVEANALAKILASRGKSGIAWATRVISTSGSGFGFAAASPIACSRRPGRCIRSAAKRFSTSTRTCSAAPWWASDRPAGSGP